jgi:uncharacterized protein (DUF2461 family)
MTEFQPIFAFLHDLRQNNNHDWFAAHRPEYEEARTLFEDFIFDEYPAACCGDGQETVLRKAAYSECND